MLKENWNIFGMMEQSLSMFVDNKKTPHMLIPFLTILITVVILLAFAKFSNHKEIKLNPEPVRVNAENSNETVPVNSTSNI